ncbi:helix-turn-helix domain-containing protein [Actinocorallia longicatena]|uniref:TetR/AcrR family transcriptional regulator n=1 Tax=Actinocorallia longicatena TaxID=111803 RepID=A0ABP6QKR9_9ACTN
MSENRQWARADATRQALLDAAQAVFADRGYAGAGIAEIVERSGISVGSLYHHYGGKAGLYLALWEDYTTEQERRATLAVKAARAEGEKDPIQLFILGSRAFLEVCWEQRTASRLFQGGEGPSGFGLTRRARARQWIESNTRLLGATESRVLALVLTTVMGEAGREVAAAESDQEALEVIGEVTAILGRLAR